MAIAELNMEVVVITKEELRALIREEVQKLVEPGAQRPPYLPYVQPSFPGLPEIWCGTSSVPADANKGYVINDGS